MDNFTTYLQAAELALVNYLGTDDLNEATVELVADCMRQAVAALPNRSYYYNLLEKASTYVLTDMNEHELRDFTCELEDALEECGLL